MNRQRGFTLVEMAMVLVIIALIIGAVLVGRELIKVSQTRSQVSQINEILVAVQTFKLKYGALPGDISTAVSMGIGTNTTLHNGDGNGKLDRYCFSAFHTTVYNNSKESDSFFMHLSNANLIKNPFGGYLSVPSGTWWTQVEADSQFPKGKAWSNSYIIPSQYNAVDECTIGAVTATDTLGQGVGILLKDWDDGGSNFDRTSVTGDEAKLLDGKVDDGALGTGTVRMQSTDGYLVGAVNTTMGSCSTTPPSSYPNCRYVRGLHWVNQF